MLIDNRSQATYAHIFLSRLGYKPHPRYRHKWMFGRNFPKPCYSHFLTAFKYESPAQRPETGVKIENTFFDISLWVGVRSECVCCDFVGDLIPPLFGELLEGSSLVLAKHRVPCVPHATLGPTTGQCTRPDGGGRQRTAWGVWRRRGKK